MSATPGTKLATSIMLVAALAAGCTAATSREGKRDAAAPVTDAATLAALDAAIAGDHRSASNRARDTYRHPRETLAFFGLRRNMTVMEIWPGAGGWYTEILAPVLRDRGRLIAASWDPDMDNKFVQDGLVAYRAKLDARPDVYDKVDVVALHHPTKMEPVPPGSVDMILTFRNIHNWMPRDAAVPMLEAMYAALRPGGILGVVEHRAKPDEPQDPNARSGYVRADFAVALVEGVGFELLESSEVNANPSDTKDYERGVWTLPPTLRLGDADRDRYLSIGESDRFTLKFRKPLD